MKVCEDLHICWARARLCVRTCAASSHPSQGDIIFDSNVFSFFNGLLLGGAGRGDLIEQFMTIKQETRAPLSQERLACISSPLGRALHLKSKQNRFVPVLLVKLKLFSANLNRTESCSQRCCCCCCCCTKITPSAQNCSILGTKILNCKSAR